MFLALINVKIDVKNVHSIIKHVKIGVKNQYFEKKRKCMCMFWKIPFQISGKFYDVISGSFCLTAQKL